MVDLSICIVNYNDCDLVLNLLNDIYKYTTAITFDVFVVDNNSADSSVEQIKKNYPKVNLIESETNIGFGAGNNLLLSKLNSRYHAVINPDIVLRSNIFKTLGDYMDFYPEVAVVTPKIFNSDLSEQFLPKKRPTLRYMLGRFSRYSKIFQDIRADYTRSDENFVEPVEIDFCTGCFMFMRTELFKKLGGFDEDYFMYLEDADLSYRIQKYGKIMFYPNESVIHQWERTSAKSFKYLIIHAKSLFTYFRKIKNYEKEKNNI